MPPFVAELNASLQGKLLKDLEDQGFEIGRPPHMVFQGKKKGLTCSLYQSGKLVVQGKNSKEFIEFYLEPELLGNFQVGYEKEFIDKTARIGVDEAGKGDFFGPLCIAGVYGGEKEIDELLKIGVKDSKTITDGTILKMGPKIREKIPHHVIRISPEKYNQLYTQFKNLNYLLAWSHATTIEALVKQTGCKNALIDQFCKAPLVANFLKKKDLGVVVTQRTKAESDPIVAAASILARESFLRGIDWLSEKLGVKIPKGAAPIVKKVGLEILKEHGPEIFQKIAKSHFKTLDEILKKHTI